MGNQGTVQSTWGGSGCGGLRDFLFRKTCKLLNVLWSSLPSCYDRVPAAGTHLELGQRIVSLLGQLSTGLDNPEVKSFTNISNKAKKGMSYRLREATATGPVLGGTGGGGEPITISGSWENL